MHKNKVLFSIAALLSAPLSAKITVINKTDHTLKEVRVKFKATGGLKPEVLKANALKHDQTSIEASVVYFDVPPKTILTFNPEHATLCTLKENPTQFQGLDNNNIIRRYKQYDIDHKPNAKKRIYKESNFKDINVSKDTNYTPVKDLFQGPITYNTYKVSARNCKITPGKTDKAEKRSDGKLPVISHKEHHGSIDLNRYDRYEISEQTDGKLVITPTDNL